MDIDSDREEISLYIKEYRSIITGNQPKKKIALRTNVISAKSQFKSLIF